jgi:hypothetical protein
VYIGKELKPSGLLKEESQPRHPSIQPLSKTAGQSPSKNEQEKKGREGEKHQTTKSPQANRSRMVSFNPTQRGSPRKDVCVPSNQETKQAHQLPG